MPFVKGHKGFRKKKVIVIAEEEPVTVDRLLDAHKQVRRNAMGLIGAMSMMDSIYNSLLTPKCKTCFHDHGLLKDCRCIK